MLQNQASLAYLAIQSTITCFLKQSNIEEQELPNIMLQEMSVQQIIRFDETHEMLFRIVDAFVSLNIIERSQNTICTGKFLKWLGLTSIQHKLIERLK